MIQQASTVKTINLPYAVRCIQRVDFPRKLGICERLFGRTLDQSGIGWVQTSSGISWKLDLTNSTHRWIVYGKYEGSPFLNWAREVLPSDGVVIDSGANIGQMLLYLAQWVPNGCVLAFEPGREQAEWLSECLRLHAELPVELVRRGLGARRERLFLRNPGEPFLHGSWNQVSDNEGEPIEIVRLADEFAVRPLAKIDLWKLDVEGYEIQALTGAEDLLREKLIRALYIEMVEANGLAIRDYLFGLGYECHVFSRRGKLYQPRSLPRFVNGLFLPV